MLGHVDVYKEISRNSTTYNQEKSEYLSWKHKNTWVPSPPPRGLRHRTEPVPGCCTVPIVPRRSLLQRCSPGLADTSLFRRLQSKGRRKAVWAWAHHAG